MDSRWSGPCKTKGPTTFDRWKTSFLWRRRFEAKVSGWGEKIKLWWMMNFQHLFAKLIKWLLVSTLYFISFSPENLTWCFWRIAHMIDGRKLRQHKTAAAELAQIFECRWHVPVCFRDYWAIRKEFLLRMMRLGQTQLSYAFQKVRSSPGIYLPSQFSFEILILQLAW